MWSSVSVSVVSVSMYPAGIAYPCRTLAVTLTNLLGTVTADADGHDFAENDSGGDSENDSGEDSDHEDLESESESSENDDEEGIEENFGAEDGEGMFGDIEDEEGYAPL